MKRGRLIINENVSIAIIDNAREAWANGIIDIGLLFIVITFLSAVLHAFVNNIRKPMIRSFLSAVISIIAIISMTLIYIYILYHSKLDSLEFMIGLAIMMFVAITDNYLIDYVIMKDSQATVTSTTGSLKRKRIKL